MGYLILFIISYICVITCVWYIGYQHGLKEATLSSYNKGRKDEFEAMRAMGFVAKNWNIIRPQNKEQN